MEEMHICEDLLGLGMTECGCLKLGFGRVLISGSTELNWVARVENKCSVLPSLANLFHIWHDIKLSLHIQFTLLGVCKHDVDLLAFFDGVPERLWLIIATYGKHPEYASCRFYNRKCMNVGRLYRFNKHMHGKSPTDYYANYAATTWNPSGFRKVLRGIR